MDEPQKKRDKVCVGIDRGTGGDLCAYVIAKVTPDKHIYILFYGTLPPETAQQNRCLELG